MFSLLFSLLLKSNHNSTFQFCEVLSISGSIANVICSEPLVKVMTHLVVSILAATYAVVAVFKSPISGLPKLSKLIIVLSTHPPLKAIDILRHKLNLFSVKFLS